MDNQNKNPNNINTKSVFEGQNKQNHTLNNMQNNFNNQNKNPNNINTQSPTIYGQNQSNQSLNKMQNNNQNIKNPTIQQYQPNQLYNQSNGMNQPYNYSFQNINPPYSNLTQNQPIPQNQPNPYQNSPYMQFYQPPQFGNINSQPQIPNNINYENINNISQLPHGIITQPDDNTFLFDQRGAIAGPIIMFFISIIFLIIPFFIKMPIIFVMYIVSLIPIIISICLCINIELSIHFILGPNNITVKKKTCCSQKTLVYNSGDLLRVEFQENVVVTRRRRFNRRVRRSRFIYDIVFVSTNMGPEIIHSVRNSSSLTFQEIDYFLYRINKHIQTKMYAK